jgi:hypothetical protein
MFHSHGDIVPHGDFSPAVEFIPCASGRQRARAMKEVL